MVNQWLFCEKKTKQLETKILIKVKMEKGTWAGYIFQKLLLKGPSKFFWPWQSASLQAAPVHRLLALYFIYIF